MIALIAKWVARTGLLVLAFLTIAVVAVAIVLNTESGTRWAIDRVNARLSGELAVADFEGTLWRGLRIDALTYTDANQRIEVEKLVLDPDWPSLLAGRAAIDTLTADSLTRRKLGPPAPDDEPFRLEMAALPVAIQVRDGAVNTLVMLSANSRQELQGIVTRKLRVSGNRFVATKAEFRNELLSAKLANFSIKLNGRVPTSGELGWQLSDGSWSGQGTVSGNLAELQFQQDIVGAYPGSTEGVVRILDRVEPEYDASFESELTIGEHRYVVSGVATGNRYELSEFVAKVGGEPGELDLVGRIAWVPELSASAAASASHIDPAAFWPELEGELQATANLAVDQDRVLRVSDLAINGFLNKAEVRGSGHVLAAAERLQCTKCTLYIAANRIDFDGESVGDELAFSFALIAPELHELVPELRGKAVGRGSVNGAASDPRIAGTVTLNNLAYKQVDFGELLVALRGNRSNLAINADWKYEDLAAKATGAVTIGDDLVAGRVREATVSKEHLGSWDLQNAFAFRWADGNTSIGSNEWRGTLGDVNFAQLSLVDDTLRTVATARNIPLQFGDNFLPSNYRLSGTGSADIDLSRESGIWAGSLNWQQANTVLRVIEANGDVTEIVVPRAEINAALVNGGLEASAAVAVDPGLSGEINVELEQLSIDAPMTGSLRLRGDDWSWISAVIPQIDLFDGSIGAAVEAQGPLNAPGFSGTAEWRDGSVVVPASNVQLKDINVVVSGAPNGEASVTGEATAGSGRLQIAGRFRDLMQITRSAEFSISGDGAELVNWPEYQVWGTPDITIAGNTDAWHASGQLDVPKANIALREVPVGAVTLSPDIVVLGEQEETIRPTRLTGDVRLVLGRRVQFAALGLDTRLTGNVLFKQVEGRPISAEGRLNLVDGTYAAHGQTLKIEQGELTFTGPLDDPLVDVRAVRVIDTFDGIVTAGIHLRGRAQNLTTTVYSEPAMADADALSYLIIGRPLNQATSTDGGELSGAAIALGLRQATRITDQIGQTLGLDQLSLAGDGGDTTALVAGKQINSRLHARYAYGVFSRLGTLLLRYRMSRNLTLEAGAGENQSLDVLYTIEK